MTSLTQGEALPNIKTSKTTATTGPEWYNQYLQSLAKPGMDLMGKTGEELVAGFDPLQQDVINNAKGALSNYRSLLDQAGADARTAAQGITPEAIQRYMDPYRTSVTNEMTRQVNQNFQRNMMPALTGQFVGTGGAGSQRALNAMGQMGADVNQNLTGAINKSLSDAYGSAVSTAGTQAGLVRQGAEAEKGIATADLDSTMKQLAAQYGYGEDVQKLNQQRILAPLSAATTAGNVYANLKVPSTVTENADAPIPGAYSTSLLSQLTGLGSLFSSPTGGQSPASGFTNWLFGSGAPGQTGYNSGVLNDLKTWYNTNYGDNGPNTIP
jgi:hypothetical protein